MHRDRSGNVINVGQFVMWKGDMEEYGKVVGFREERVLVSVSNSNEGTSSIESKRGRDLSVVPG